ncbi:hypothetical protein CA13_08910 [Planctomycetes bacterium CA13]|uniref:Uncharacterized protein n=2 Tax=Novipirellula herctigrandis TaxID=2527986 RepID=A0A5C5YWS0_9BACT|nr:hypothetical protein CA13_08910 [Planctomycetes bacterium CA13]
MLLLTATAAMLAAYAFPRLREWHETGAPYIVLIGDISPPSSAETQLAFRGRGKGEGEEKGKGVVSLNYPLPLFLTGQPQCVVSIGLSLGVLPGPCFVVGAADDGFEFSLVTNIADPPGRAAGFHDDEVDIVGLEQVIDVRDLGEDGFESVGLIFGIEEAGHRLELAEVERTDYHGTVPWFEVSTC